MRRNTHDGAGTVIHQNVVRHPYRHSFAVIWIDGEVSRVDTVLFNFPNVATLFGFLLLGNELRYLQPQGGIERSQLLCNGMFRSELYRSRTVNRVNACGENRDDIATGVIEAEIYQRAFAASDPVALHGADFFRPTR